MNSAAINQRIVLIRARGLGWEGPDYPAPLDELEHEARRWLARWSEQAEEALASHDNAGAMRDQNAYWSE